MNVVIVFSVRFVALILSHSFTFLYFQICKRKLEEDAEENGGLQPPYKLAMTSYPFLPLQLYGIPGFPLSCYGYRPPEAHRNGSTDNLRMKAREHEAAIEMNANTKL